MVIPCQPLHVIQRGNKQQSIFFTAADFLPYPGVLRNAQSKHGCLLRAYVFLTNQVHFFVAPDRHPLEGCYKSALIEFARYLMTCSRYIELYPLWAGMVSEPGDYPWSSYRANALGVMDACVSPRFIYQAMAVSEKIR